MQNQKLNIKTIIGIYCLITSKKIFEKQKNNDIWATENKQEENKKIIKKGIKINKINKKRKKFRKKKK